MSDRSNENVPRGDHVPGGPNDETSTAEMNQKAEPGVDSAPQRGHGAHGKGVQEREEHDDNPTPTPPPREGLRPRWRFGVGRLASGRLGDRQARGPT